MDKAILEEKMAQGFLPEQHTQLDFRGPIALEYIAFFLGRIDKKLGLISDALATQRTLKERPPMGSGNFWVSRYLAL